MIEKLELPSSARLVCEKDYDLAFKYIKQTVNQLVDAVNAILDYAPLEMAMKAEPEFITTSYTTDGHTQEYYGQNGARVQFDHPIPAGYTITIIDPTPAENVQSEKIADGFLEPKKRG